MPLSKTAVKQIVSKQTPFAAAETFQWAYSPHLLVPLPTATVEPLLHAGSLLL